MKFFVVTLRVLVVSIFAFILFGCGDAGSDKPNSQTPSASTTQPPDDNGSGQPTDNGSGGSSNVVYSVSPISGVVSLTVNFSTQESIDTTSYLWDFGDGNSAMGPNQVHVYNQPGIYTTRLTVTDVNNNEYSAERVVHAFASLDSSSVIVPGTALFFDDFDYLVGREDSNVVSIFQSHGWGGVKTEQSPTSRGASGYVYTTDRIPGYAGPFPGRNSTSVLALEALPATFNAQTDFFLEYGYAFGSTETIPGNVWFQFWVYPNYYDDPNNLEDQMSGFGDHFKFIYPCRNTYPCQDQSWLFTMGSSSDTPFYDYLGLPAQDLYMGIANLGTAGTFSYPGVDWNMNLGETNISERLVSNRWTLVKIHIDTSTSSGTYEVWLKPLGGQWVKVSEWIDGTNDFTWTLNNIGGHSVFRMPTTVGRATATDLFDFWLYMDDFTMANSESDLPAYPY